MINSRYDFIADPLDELHADHNDDDGDDHDLGIEALVTVVIGQASESATADEAGHGRIADEDDHGVGGGGDESWEGFGEKDFGDDLAVGHAHDLGGVDGAGGNFPQGGFDEAGEERCGGDGQGDGGRIRADRGTDHPLGEGDERDHQDCIRDGSGDVDDDRRQDPVGDAHGC